MEGLFGTLPRATAAVDGQRATGTDNRDKILKAHTQGRAKATSPATMT